jgi:hypothetical protein
MRGLQPRQICLIYVIIAGAYCYPRQHLHCPPIIQFHACKVLLSCYLSQFQPVLLRLEPFFQQVPLDLLSCRLCNLATRRCTLNV